MVVQIETREAIGNIRSIAEIEVLTGVFAGPSGLSASLGVFRDLRNHIFVDALKVIEYSKPELKIVGIMAYDKLEIGGASE